MFKEMTKRDAKYNCAIAKVLCCVKKAIKSHDYGGMNITQINIIKIDV